MLLTGPNGDLDVSTGRCRGVAYQPDHDAQKDRFFPERGTAQITARDAKLVCNGEGAMPACPMREACLEYAMARKERFGIWGGLSERERARLAKQRRVEKRRQELELELRREKRSESARRAWETRKRRRLEVEMEHEATMADTRSKEQRGPTIIKRRRTRAEAA